MSNFEKVGKFMKTFGQEVKNKANFPEEKIVKSFVDGSKEDISLTVTDFIKQVGAPNKIEGFDRDGDVGIKIGVTGRRAGETLEIKATESPSKILGKIQYALTGDEKYLLP